MANEARLSNATSSDSENATMETWARRLLHVVDVALAGCIFVVPLLLGGRSAVGHFGLTVLAATAASVWWLRQSLVPRQYWRRSAAHLLLVAAILLLILQLVPMPAGWLEQASPKVSQLLPLWSADASAGLPAWDQVSLAPSQTRNALVLLLAYALIFWVTVQRIRSLEDVEQFLRWVAYAVVGMSVFGLLQYATNNGKFFWVYQDPFATTEDGVKGAFTNRNHFAHFLALGIGPVIWWVQDAMRRLAGRQSGALRLRGVQHRSANMLLALRIAALATVFLALLLSGSRGGALAAGAAALLTVAVCHRAGAVRGKFALGLTAVALLLGGLLLLGDEDSMGGRLETMASGSIEQIDNGEGRRTIWNATLAAIPDFARLGSGVGSFREVYPLYMPHQTGHTIYTHAENGYLQLALETGIPGIVLLALAILIGLFWTGRGLWNANSSRSFVAIGALASGLLASIIHSGVDFVWYVPGCLVLTLILVACISRASQFFHDEDRRQRDRFLLPAPVAWLAAPLILALGTWMAASQAGPMLAASHWNNYQRLRYAVYLNPIAVEVPPQEGILPAAPAEIARNEEIARRKARATELENERKMAAELVETVRRDPANAEARLALAESYMRLFEFAQDNAVNRMSPSQIRDAALRAGYTSPEELEEWLSRAVGKQYKYLRMSLNHTKTGLRLCPLLGEGYLNLAELSFLDCNPKVQTWDYVVQALQVRPYQGTVLFHAGCEAALAERIDEALDLWERSWEAGPIYQRQVIDWTMDQLGVEAILAQFHPDLDMLRYMKMRCQSDVDSTRQTPVLEAIVKAAREEVQAELAEGRGAEACELWLEAMSACEELMRPNDAIACAQQAVECDPHSFDARYRLGFLLSDLGRFKEAEGHLSWCNRAKPGLIKLKRRLKDVSRAILDPESESSRQFGSFYPPGTEFMEARLRVPAGPASNAAPSPVPASVFQAPSTAPEPSHGAGGPPPVYRR